MSETEMLEQQLSEMLGVEPWCIDDLSLENGVLEMSGWALPPEGEHDDVTFTLNDRQFEEVNYPLPRPDIGQIFWYKPGTDRAAFHCKTTVQPEEDFTRGYVSLKCVRKRTGLPLREEFNYYYPNTEDEPAMPDVERRKRVSGGERAEAFRLEGFTNFVKLDQALRRVAGKGLDQFSRVLDWGCGCGRTTRYLQRLPETKVVGVDIDADNVEWCRQHLANGEYRHVSLHPPVDLELSAYDVIIGISVFSHLTERDHIEWLYELHRIARPGAILLMSILSEASVSRASFPPALVEEWHASGFIAHSNQDLKGYIEDESYYVNTCITEDYIRRQWSRFFNLLEIIPAYIGNQQDLVVMRKPD